MADKRKCPMCGCADFQRGNDRKRPLDLACAGCGYVLGKGGGRIIR